MRSLLSIIRLTLAHAIRMKVAIIIIVFLAIVIPSLPFVLKTDETQHGHVQITLTYSLGMVFFLLMVMTIFIGSASISNEIAGGQMQLLDTKPIRRWQIILGKWLGIMLLNTALVVILGGVAFGLTKFIGRPSAIANEEQRESEQRKLRNSVFTARISIDPLPPPGIDEKVDKEFEERKQQGRIPNAWKIRDKDGNFKPGEYKETEYKEELRNLELKREGVVPPGTAKAWKFEDIRVNRTDGEEVIYLRYNVRTTESRRDRMFAGRWVVGDRESIEVPFYRYVEETVGSPHELAVPATSIKPDGSVDVEFLNLTRSDDGQRGINAVFNPQEGLELMYRRSGFLSNYIRYFILVTTILGFIAMISVAASSFMSFPVAALLTISIVLNCYGLATFKEFAYAKDPMAAETTGSIIRTGATKIVYQVMSRILPDLSQYGMLSKLNSGRYIPVSLVLWAVLILTVLYGGIIYAIGCIIFSREELG